MLFVEEINDKFVQIQETSVLLCVSYSLQSTAIFVKRTIAQQSYSHWHLLTKWRMWLHFVFPLELLPQAFFFFFFKIHPTESLTMHQISITTLISLHSYLLAPSLLWFLVQLSCRSHICVKSSCLPTATQEKRQLALILLFYVNCCDRFQGISSNFSFKVLSNKSIIFQSIIISNDQIHVEALCLPHTHTH